MKFKELKQSLSNSAIQNVYVLFGNDPFLIQSATKQLVAKCELQNEEFNFSAFEENALPQDVVACAMSYPLMSEKKVVKYSVSKNADLSLIQEYAKNPSPETVLLIVCSEKPKLTSKEIVWVDCNIEEETTVEMWARSMANSKGLKITFDAMQLLCAFCQYNMARITVEIEKLKLFDKQIDTRDIEENVAKDLNYQIFEISNCLNRQNGNEMDVLKSILEKNGDKCIPIIFSVLFNNYKNMYAVKSDNLSDYELALQSSQKEYSFKMARRNAKDITMKKIVANMKTLAEYDFAFKNGKISAKDAIKVAVLKCR